MLGGLLVDLDRNMDRDIALNLFRHVQVLNNINKSEILCGRYATPITEKGREDAEKLREILYNSDEMPNSLKNPSVIFTSPTERTIKTKEIIYKDRSFIKTDLVAERTYGKYDGRNVNDVIKELGLVSGALKDFRGVFTQKSEQEKLKKLMAGSESLDEVLKRAEEFVKYVELNGWDNVAVFSHLVFLKMLIGVCCGLSKEQILKLYIRNCSPGSPVVLRKRKGSKLYTLEYPNTWDKLTR